MIDYSELECWYEPKIIKRAIKIAQDATYYSRTKESYFTDNPDDFCPHIWVISAICNTLLYSQQHLAELND